ncbi:MAG: hypothetical protein GXO39_03010 [Thermotogae bacterium]|nr:hypothetical protein [Thermotogota bacterium]
MIEQVLKYVKERFGIPRNAFRGFRFFQRGRDVWIVSEDVPDLRYVNRAGLRFARGGTKNPKLTTTAIQIFGRFATKNVVDINEEQLESFLKGEDLVVGTLNGISKGQVIVRYGSDPLGSGLYDGNKIKNQIPKARRILP